MGELGRHIQAVRQKRKMTVRALAAAVGKTPGYLSRVECRHEIPAPELICVIGDALNEKPEMLLEMAKNDLLKRTRLQIEEKSTNALNLYRKSR